MTARPLFAPNIARTAAQSAPRVQQPRELDDLRRAALRCRASARTELAEACAVLARDEGRARMAAAELLTRCLTQLLGRPPTFFRPGEAQMSFDEAWLTRLLEACRQGDDDSFAFLIRSRIPLMSRVNFASLVRLVAAAPTSLE